MSENLPPVLDRADMAKAAVEFAAERGWLPDWLVRLMQGGAGGGLLFAILALFGPLGDKPEPAPTEAPPTAGTFYTEQQLALYQRAYEMAGERKALLNLQDALAADRVESTRFIIKDLLEKVDDPRRN